MTDGDVLSGNVHTEYCTKSDSILSDPRCTSQISKHLERRYSNNCLCCVNLQP